MTADAKPRRGTGISWTDETWNPVIGCSRVSEGCRHCYAEVQAQRIVRMGGPAAATYADVVTTKLRVISDDEQRVEPRWTGKVKFLPERLQQPLAWTRPRRVFVNSMSDLFHEDLGFEAIAAVFGIMATARQHTFQILTKRPARMLAWFQWVREVGLSMCLSEAFSNLPRSLAGTVAGSMPWPLSNVWLGVSAEDQARADERLPLLMRTPAARRFVSIEPILGPIDLEPWLYVPTVCRACGSHSAIYDTNPKRLAPLRDRRGDVARCLMGVPQTGEPGAIRCATCNSLSVDELDPLDWVIVGCESGQGARPAQTSWFVALRDQLIAARVAHFLKQAVEDLEEVETPGPEGPMRVPAVFCGDGSKRKPGGVIELPYLHGRQHAAFPEPPDA